MHLLRLCMLALPCCVLLAADANILDRLPTSAGIADHADGPRWHDVAILDITPNRDVVVGVGGCQVVVARSLIAHDDREAAAALPALLARATAAGRDPAHLRLERGLLTGVHLHSDEALILTDEILLSDSLAAPDLAAQQQRVRVTATVLAETLGNTRLTALGQGALRRVLTTLCDTTVTDEDFTPALVRQLLKSGWLSDELMTLPTWQPLQVALAQAMTPQPLHRWQAEHTQLTEYVDAFAQHVFVLTTRTGSARLQTHARPFYDALAARMVVQRFAAGVDPLSAIMPLSAEVWWGRQRVAQWQAESGFSADVAQWRTILPDNGPGVGADTVVEWRPPHVVLTDPYGAVIAICTAHGVLRPALPGNPQDRERFLADAARMSPDAQHLDLIGQYLFSYVHDSPDPQHPGLIGVKGRTGEIHQTVGQTVDTVCAGVMRGDCDDLAEVYHDLLTRQGHLPQVMSLPSHAACAWSVHEGDRWTTQVLQTGQPLAFHGETLEESLAHMFSHFDKHNTDRGTLVHLLLRFAGENTRTQWQLGSRIMRDAEYARTMIAVQRDWYFHTHAQGIATMRSMIAAGDDASANWSELAGLYRRTGQWRPAITAERVCLARIADPTTSLDVQLALISLLIHDGQHAEAELQANALLTVIKRTGTEAQRGLRQRMISSVYGVLPEAQHHDFKQRILQEHLLPALEIRRQELTRWAQTRFDRRVWVEQTQDDRYGAALLINAAQVALTREGAHLDTDPELQRLVTFADQWLTDLAFLDTGERDDVMDAYANVGQQASAILGESTFDALLDQAINPPTWTSTHARRSHGLPQLIHDLPWIRISVPYWSHRLGVLLGKTDVLLNDAAALHVIMRLRAASEACAHLDIQTTGLERTMLWVNLCEALVQRDENTLRTALRACAERRDRSTDDLVTSTIVTMSRHLPPSWFRRVLALWDKEAATKPGYFTIAWGCALAGRIPQALEAGALAAQRGAEDPTFPAEFVYLQQVLAGGDEP